MSAVLAPHSCWQLLTLLVDWLQHSGHNTARGRGGRGQHDGQHGRGRGRSTGYNSYSHTGQAGQHRSSATSYQRGGLSQGSHGLPGQTGQASQTQVQKYGHTDPKEPGHMDGPHTGGRHRGIGRFADRGGRGPPGRGNPYGPTPAVANERYHSDAYHHGSSSRTGTSSGEGPAGAPRGRGRGRGIDGRGGRGGPAYGGHEYYPGQYQQGVSGAERSGGPPTAANGPSSTGDGAVSEVKGLWVPVKKSDGTITAVKTTIKQQRKGAPQSQNPRPREQAATHQNPKPTAHTVSEDQGLAASRLKADAATFEPGVRAAAPADGAPQQQQQPPAQEATSMQTPAAPVTEQQPATVNPAYPMPPPQMQMPPGNPQYPTYPLPGYPQAFPPTFPQGYPPNYPHQGYPAPPGYNPTDPAMWIAAMQHAHAQAAAAAVAAQNPASQAPNPMSVPLATGFPFSALQMPAAQMGTPYNMYSPYEAYPYMMAAHSAAPPTMQPPSQVDAALPPAQSHPQQPTASTIAAQPAATIAAADGDDSPATANKQAGSGRRYSAMAGSLTAAAT